MMKRTSGLPQQESNSLKKKIQLVKFRLKVNFLWTNEIETKNWTRANQAKSAQQSASARVATANFAWKNLRCCLGSTCVNGDVAYVCIRLRLRAKGRRKLQ